MKATVDQDTCIGCGLCPSVCPEVFSMDEENDKAQAITEDIPSDEESAAEDARDGCPVSAIDIN
ncbi:MAG: ferredoxin [Cellulosilyticaceae bacterium]